MNRTLFALLIFIWGCFSLNAAGQPGTAKRPNILFIAADDMNMLALSGNYPLIKTPALDALRNTSYFFKNASCAAPVCTPSRTSFWSGLYPFHTGAYYNGVNPWEASKKLGETEVIPETFRRNGYITWGGGKIFHVIPNDNRENKMFDNKVFKGGYGPFSDKAHQYGKGKWMAIEPWSGPDTDFPDVRTINAAMTFLSQKHDRPFFMYCGLYRPHSPYTAPRRFFDLYTGTAFSPPPGYKKDDLDDIPEMGRALVDSLNGLHRTGSSRQEVWMEMMKAYAANMSFADWNIGRIIDALDHSAYADNTVVIFISDNGFHTGSKMHWVKSTLWDGADIVPFLIRLPGGKKRVCTQTINLIDIYPTLVELCNLEPPSHQLDGRSIVPVLEDPRTIWNRSGITTYGVGYTGIRTEKYRYIRYPDGSEELYDHDGDPFEWKNLAGLRSMKTVKDSLALAVPRSFAPSLGGRGPAAGGDE